MRAFITIFIVVIMSVTTFAQKPMYVNRSWEIYVGLTQAGSSCTVSATNVGGTMWGASYMITDSIEGGPFAVVYDSVFESVSTGWPYGFDFINSINSVDWGCNKLNSERYLPYGLVRIDFDVQPKTLAANGSVYSIYLDLRDDRFNADIWIRFSTVTRTFQFSIFGLNWITYTPSSTIRILDYYVPSNPSTSKFQPTNPSNLSVTWGPSYSHPELRWAASEPASSIYDIYRRTLTSTSYILISSSYANTVFIDTSITCNMGSYYYKVVARSGDLLKSSPGHVESGPFSTSPCPLSLNNYAIARDRKADSKGYLFDNDETKSENTSSAQQKYSSSVIFQPDSLRGYLINNGDVFTNPNFSSEGLFWPASTKKNLVFTAGLCVAGKDEYDSVRTAISYLLTNYQPGTIKGTYADTNLSVASNPYDSTYRILVLSDTSTIASADYQSWVKNSAKTGAPLNPDGTPKLLGDLNAYWVMNDLDTTDSRETRPNNLPMGLEIHNYVFGYNDIGPLSNTIFILMDVINKSSHGYDSTYFGRFNDIDLGGSVDDLPGCDSLLSLGYMYNGNDTDQVFGANPPACGFIVLASPAKSATGASMTSFTKDVSSSPDYLWKLPFMGHANESTQWWNVLQGKLVSGTPITPPNEPGHVITYVDPGDPLNGIGWIAAQDQSPSDNRLLLGSGPFTFTPDDTQRFVAAFIVAQDTSRLSSIAKLKQYVPLIKDKWASIITQVGNPKPVMSSASAFELSEGYPNPFNPSTNFIVTLKQRSQIEITIYDVLGQEVATLYDGKMDQGSHPITWNGRRSDGTTIASGIYFCKMTVVDPQGKLSYGLRKLTLIK